LADVKQKTGEFADQNRKSVYPQACCVTNNLFTIITENVVAQPKISSTLTSKPSTGFTQFPSSQSISTKPLQSCLLKFPPVFQGDFSSRLKHQNSVCTPFLPSLLHASQTSPAGLRYPKKRHDRAEKFALELQEQFLCRWW